MKCGGCTTERNEAFPRVTTERNEGMFPLYGRTFCIIYVRQSHLIQMTAGKYSRFFALTSPLIARQEFIYRRLLQKDGLKEKRIPARR